MAGVAAARMAARVGARMAADARMAASVRVAGGHACCWPGSGEGASVSSSDARVWRLVGVGSAWNAGWWGVHAFES